MVRVLLVGKGPPERGGIPTYLQMLLSSRLEEDHDLSFLNLTRSGAQQGGRATLENLRRTLLDARRVWLAAAGQDVVHVHSSLQSWVTILRAGLLALTARSRGARVLVHAHGGLLLMWLAPGLRSLLLRLALSPAELVLAVSRELQDRLVPILGPSRVRLVDNGVDTTVFTPSRVPSDPPRILYVGILTPRKGLLDLVQASQTLVERGVRHELVLVGGTPDEGAEAAGPVVMAAEQAGAQMLGIRRPEEMPGIYATADVFCLPSWWEAMPLSVLEAMASGLPVVATDVGDVSRLVRSGDTGCLVAPRDVSGLSRALEHLLTDSESRRRMGSSARRLVTTEFDASATIATLDHIYDGTRPLR